MGHIHLRVTNLERSIMFYQNKLGLDMTADWRSMGAAFLSEGGYHHHIGINTWYSLDGGGRRDDATGLKNFTIIASDALYYNLIRSNIMNDPSSGNQIAQNGASNKFTITDPDGIQIVIRTG